MGALENHEKATIKEFADIRKRKEAAIINAYKERLKKEVKREKVQMFTQYNEGIDKAIEIINQTN